MAQLNFDARQVDPQPSFEPIPAGWYNMMIIDSEMKPTRDGNGAYLQLTLKVIDGQYAGRQIFDRLSIQHQNPIAAEIAYRRLSAYCHATGVLQIQDSQQLHGIPLKVRVSVRTDSTGQYEPSNEIKAVKPINEDTGTTAAPAQPWQQPSAQQGFQQPQQAPQQPWQQPPVQQAPAPQQPVQQAPAQGGAPTPPWVQDQQAPVQEAQPATQSAPVAGSTPPWAQARR
jgi:hypothetical protein